MGAKAKGAKAKAPAISEAEQIKRMNMGVKVPEWLELSKKDRAGTILRLPVRADVTLPVEEHLIVELYSK